jgi:hypothetical protein
MSNNVDNVLLTMNIQLIVDGFETCCNPVWYLLTTRYNVFMSIRQFIRTFTFTDLLLILRGTWEVSGSNSYLSGGLLY